MRSKFTRCFAFVAAWLVLGCSGEAPLEDESLGSLQQMFGTGQCATARAVKTSVSRFSYVSPGGYGTACNPVEVTSLHSANGANMVMIDPAVLPTYETDCMQMFVRAVLYEKSGSSWAFSREITNFGYFAGSCKLQPANFGRLTPGGSYRIAATARPFDASPAIGLPFSVTTQLIH